MQLSPAELELVRSRPQSTELYLSIFQPRTVMTCEVTGSYTRGARSIGYYNVSTGSISSIEAGMTLLVGTTPGGRELGKIRIRSGTSSQFIVAENGHVDWTSARYLTAQRYWEVWPVYPRIISDPSNNENVIFYKDYDVPYTNQNSILGAFPCAGPEIRGAFTGEQLFWSATGTSHVVGSALTYEWAFEGGNVTGSTSHTPGWVTYNQPGNYVTRLKVNGVNGSQDITYRYVTIRDKFDSGGSNTPLRNWTLSSLSGSRGAGGYTATIRIINENITVNDGDLVVLWSNDWYGDTNQSLGGNSPNNSKVFFSGHVMDGSISYNHADSSIEFQVASVSDLMKASEGFSVSVESSTNPSKWFQVLDLDGRRAIYHYLKWHSTVLSVVDFRFVGTDQNIQYFDSDRASIFDAIDNYMRGTLLGEVVVDRQGILWADVGTAFYSNPTGSFPTHMEMTRRDWANEPNIIDRKISPLSFIEVGGIAYSGPTTGTFTAHLSNAPTSVPNTRGSVTRQQGLAVSGQTHTNQISGNLYAEKNSRYPSIDMPLAGNYRNLDIAPLESVDVNIGIGDTNSGIVLHAPYIVDSMSWDYRADSKILLPRIGLRSLVSGASGETLTIPDVPDTGGYGDAGVFGGLGFSPGRFPPFMSTFSNKACGAWSGYGLADFDGGVFYSGFPVVTGTYYSYGMALPTVSFGNGGVGIAPVAGVYNVTVNLELINIGASEDYMIFITYNPTPTTTRTFRIWLQGTIFGTVSTSFSYSCLCAAGEVPGFSFQPSPEPPDSHFFLFHSSAALVYSL